MNANVEMSTPADEMELVAERTAVDRRLERADRRIRRRLRHGVTGSPSRSVVVAEEMELFRGLTLPRRQDAFYKHNE